MNEQKKWVVLLTYSGKEIQIDEEEYGFLLEAMEKGKSLLRLKDKTLISTRPVAVLENAKYLSETDIKKIKMKREYLQEYLELKRTGKFSNVTEYLNWKRKKNDSK